MATRTVLEELVTEFIGDDKDYQEALKRVSKNTKVSTAYIEKSMKEIADSIATGFDASSSAKELEDAANKVISKAKELRGIFNAGIITEDDAGLAETNRALAEMRDEFDALNSTISSTDMTGVFDDIDTAVNSVTPDLIDLEYNAQEVADAMTEVEREARPVLKTLDDLIDEAIAFGDEKVWEDIAKMEKEFAGASKSGDKAAKSLGQVGKVGGSLKAVAAQFSVAAIAFKISEAAIQSVRDYAMQVKQLEHELSKASKLQKETDYLESRRDKKFSDELRGMETAGQKGEALSERLGMSDKNVQGLERQRAAAQKILDKMNEEHGFVAGTREALAGSKPEREQAIRELEAIEHNLDKARGRRDSAKDLITDMEINKLVAARDRTRDLDREIEMLRNPGKEGELAINNELEDMVRLLGLGEKEVAALREKMAEALGEKRLRESQETFFGLQQEGQSIAAGPNQRKQLEVDIESMRHAERLKGTPEEHIQAFEDQMESNFAKKQQMEVEELTRSIEEQTYMVIAGRSSQNQLGMQIAITTEQMKRQGKTKEDIDKVTQSMIELEAVTRGQKVEEDMEDIAGSMEDFGLQAAGVPDRLVEINRKLREMKIAGFSDEEISKVGKALREQSDLAKATEMKLESERPMEKYKKRVEEINDLRKKGLIDAQTFADQHNKALEIFAPTRRSAENTIDAADARSTSFRSLAMNQARGGSGDPLMRAAMGIETLVEQGKDKKVVTIMPAGLGGIA